VKLSLATYPVARTSSVNPDEHERTRLGEVR
jgi:hypothetical protein